MKNRKLKRFNELMTPEESSKLGLFSFLQGFDNDDYFFRSKPINKLWDEGLIKIYVYNVTFDGDSLVFDTKIDIGDENFDIFILVNFDETVEFGSEKGPEYIGEFESAIEDELDYFKDMFEDVYSEIIPHDFWEVKSRNN